MIGTGNKSKTHFYVIKEVPYANLIEDCRGETPFYLYVLILTEYLKIVSRTILNGYSWKFSKGFGELLIVKKGMTMKILSMRKKFTQPKFGFHYIGLIMSVFLDENGMKFQLCDKLQKEVERIVQTKERDYRYEY